MLPSWHFFQCEWAKDWLLSSDIDISSFFPPLIISIITTLFFIKSIQPLIKAVMHKLGTTAHTDLRRRQHWGPKSFSVQGEENVSDCNLSTCKSTGNVCNCCHQGKNTPKVNLFVTWRRHVWTWSECTYWTLPFAPFCQWTMCNLSEL